MLHQPKGVTLSMQERNIDAANVADDQSNPLPVPPPYSIGLTEPPNNQNLIYLLHLLLVVLRLVIKESVKVLQCKSDLILPEFDSKVDRHLL